MVHFFQLKLLIFQFDMFEIVRLFPLLRGRLKEPVRLPMRTMYIRRIKNKEDCPGKSVFFATNNDVTVFIFNSFIKNPLKEKKAMQNTQNNKSLLWKIDHNIQYILFR